MNGIHESLLRLRNIHSIRSYGESDVIITTLLSKAGSKF